ncbi:MAG: hypothetical protein JXQ23_11310 [Clostridia bacterium]|nr:hypothetical protein [Clostridia bacterium]
MKYSNTHEKASFLIGGIGSGNFSIGSRGQLKSFEMFNKPGINNYLPFTFACIKIKEKNKPAVLKVLEAKFNQPYEGSHGLDGNNAFMAAGLPRLEKSKIYGKAAICHVDFYDKRLPVKISMKAYSPFIPLDEDNSGLPLGHIEYTIENLSDKEIDVSIAFSMSNATGSGLDNDEWKEMAKDMKKKNTFVDMGVLKGIHYESIGLESNQINSGDMALLTFDENVSYKEQWLNQGYYDGLNEFWKDFKENDKLNPHPEYIDGLDKPQSTPATASICVNKIIKAKSKQNYNFLLSWYFPNRYNSWDYQKVNFRHGEDGSMTRNYYATKFKSAIDVSDYYTKNRKHFFKTTEQFEKALYKTTIPKQFLDSVAYNMSIIRSTTCFRIEDGTLLAYEGCCNTFGCCFGSCTHVWNYTQTLAFLFPKLERTMRRVEFLVETDEKGSMAFRSVQKFKLKRWEYHPAVDGQMGTIVRLYRDIMLSGDLELLNQVWDKVKLSLSFALDYWDSDHDYVLDSQQHNTYDIEFYGPNSLANSIFFAAVKASIKLAKIMKDEEHIKKYTEIYEKGSKKIDELLFNGEYYQQNLDDINKIRHQYGTGCISDQLLGQTLAHVANLGYLFDKENTKKAVYSIYKYNLIKDLTNHENTNRTYGVNDEGGLVVCSWPKGNKPALEFPYSSEVWPSLEYHVATHLIYEGFVNEASEIIKITRERQNGKNRNPWNEVECGFFYARSLASFGLLIACSGYQYDMINNKIGFNPKVNEDKFKCFFICEKGWGIYDHRKKKINTVYGDLSEIELDT